MTDSSPYKPNDFPLCSDRLPDYHPFRDYFDRLPRITSFIATSNSHELLSDLSGSHRFLCVEVERPIDSTNIEHTQIYAQLKTMLLGGERHGFTAEEETEIQRANVAFYRICPAEEAFARHFRAARPDEEALSVSLPELIALLRKRQPGTFTGIGIQEFSRALVAAGVERRHTEKGNRYRIVPLENFISQKDPTGLLHTPKKTTFAISYQPLSVEHNHGKEDIQ